MSWLWTLVWGYVLGAGLTSGAAVVVIGIAELRRRRREYVPPPPALTVAQLKAQARERRLVG